MLYDLSQQVHYFAMVHNLKATGMLHEYDLCYQLRIANHNIFMCKNHSGGSRGGSPPYFLAQPSYNMFCLVYAAEEWETFGGGLHREIGL